MLPFLFVAAGGPIVVAALIVPIVEICRLVGFAGAAPVIGAARGVKWHLAFILAATGGSLAIIAMATPSAPPEHLVVLFVTIAAIIGIGMAASTLVHQDLLGRLLSEPLRGRMMYGEAIFAGLLAISIAAASHYTLADDPPLHRHLALLWGGRFRLHALRHTRGDRSPASLVLIYACEAA